MSNTIYSDKIKVNCPLVHDENGYYHLIYKIINNKSGKIYIGKHSTKNPYDNYMGSGKLVIRALKKNGIENFTKEILFCFTDEKEVYLKEAEIVTKEFVDRDDTYNVITGGYGLSSEDVRGENHPLYGKSRSQESREKQSKSRKGKYIGKNNSMYGKHHTQDAKDKVSKANKGKCAGGKNPRAKAIIKLDEFGNIITEYGCIKECCKQEHFDRGTLIKSINEHTLRNGSYFEYKSNH